MDWKLTIIKSIVYRLITISLGLLTAYIIMGNFKEALGVSLVTELIQSMNYFGFESVWTFFQEKRIRKSVEQEFRKRIVDFKLTIGMVVDISKQFADLDTFNPQIYKSFIKFFETALENPELDEFKDQILESKSNFEALNQGKDFDYTE